jgi:hypothetical protein
MRHHDILPGHDYCPILDKLENKNYHLGSGSTWRLQMPVHGLFVFNQEHDSAEPKKISDAKI